MTPETADSIVLGDLRLEPRYKPPTFEERVDRELAVDRPAGERLDGAIKEAKRLRQHVLVVFLDRAAALTQSWFKLRLEDRLMRTKLPDYQLIQVDVESKGAALLADHIGVTIDEDALPLWWFSDPSGEELRAGQVPRLAEGGGLDRAALLDNLSQHAPEPLDARELLQEALAEAAASKRRVIVQETATWCGPCHLLARFLERHRDVWEKDYLWIRIDQRWHGSEEVMNNIMKGHHGGIPWFAILDSNGDVLATSDGPDGNIGFPTDPASINHFLTMLRSTKQRISENELATLRNRLQSQ
ncbi:MAG: thioredoxin family protein [Pirellulaceae bacterium]